MKKTKLLITICVNENEVPDETLRFLAMQYFDEEVEPEVVTIECKDSQDYYYVLNEKEADYKVFVESGTFLSYPYALSNLIRLMDSDNTIGLAAVSGNTAVPYDGIFWQHRNTGMIGRLSNFDKCKILDPVDNKYVSFEEVAFVGQEFYIVRGDLNINKKLDICNDLRPVAVGFELMKMDKKIVVVNQEYPWCLAMIHDTDLEEYKKGRDILFKEYTPFFQMKESCSS